MLIETPIFWALVALGLLVAERMVGRIILCVLAGSAAMVALLTLLGRLSGFPLQLSVFAIGAVLALVFLRYPFKGILYGKAYDGEGAFDTGIRGRCAKVTSELGDGMYTLTVGSTTWDGMATQPLRVDQEVRVVGRDGIMLMVEPIDGPLTADPAA